MKEFLFEDITTSCFEKKGNGGDYKRQLILSLDNTQIHEIFRNSNIILTMPLNDVSNKSTQSFLISLLTYSNY